MTNRTTKVASAILIGALAGALLAVQATALHAADNCLSGPKGVAPQGSHWYYRVDRATKRNCWYVRTEGGQTKSANAFGRPVLPQAEAPLQPSVANARAEASPAEIRQSSGVAVQPAPSAPQGNGQGSNPQAADSGQANVASRWLDQTGADTTNASAARPVDSGAVLNSPTPPVAAVDKRSSSSGSVPILLLEVVGALAIAAIFGSIIFKFGSAGRNDWWHSSRDPRAPWNSIDLGASIQSPPLATKAPMRQTSLAREPREAVIPDEIVQLLARLSKEAAT